VPSGRPRKREIGLGDKIRSSKSAGGSGRNDVAVRLNGHREQRGGRLGWSECRGHGPTLAEGRINAAIAVVANHTEAYAVPVVIQAVSRTAYQNLAVAEAAAFSLNRNSSRDHHAGCFARDAKARIQAAVRLVPRNNSCGLGEADTRWRCRETHHASAGRKQNLAIGLQCDSGRACKENWRDPAAAKTAVQLAIRVVTAHGAFAGEKKPVDPNKKVCRRQIVFESVRFVILPPRCDIGDAR